MSLLANLIPFLLPLLTLVSTTEAQTTLQWPVEEAEVLFVGDAMQHGPQINAARRAGGTYDYSECFAAIKPYIESADYAVVNFEATLGGSPYSGYPQFSAPEQYATALTDAGFDFFLLANNHILDRRDKGLHRTITTLDSMRIPHAGIYHDKAQRDTVVPAIVDVKGMKMAILNYTYGTNGISVQGPAVVDYIKRDKIAADIKAARDAGADLIAACMHWGVEYQLSPNREQTDLANYLVDQGVDLVIGSHPHVVQPMEMRTRADGSKALVVYSLGNFISNQNDTNSRGGAMTRVKLRRNPAGKAEVVDANYALVFVDKANGKHNYRLLPAETADNPTARTFYNKATQIFKSNKGVEPDSLFLKAISL